jgi:hypothetical protein
MGTGTPNHMTGVPGVPFSGRAGRAGTSMARPGQSLEANRLRNIYRRTKSKIDKTAWKAKEKERDHAIEKARMDKWREFVNKADGKTIYQIKDYITNIPTPIFIPTSGKLYRDYPCLSALVQVPPNANYRVPTGRLANAYRGA